MVLAEVLGNYFELPFLLGVHVWKRNRRLISREETKNQERNEFQLKGKKVLKTGLGRLGLEIRRAPGGKFDEEGLLHDSSGDAEIWNEVKQFTMTSQMRVQALISAVRYVVDNDIPGDFVECGVWRVGSAMAIAKVLVDLGVQDRRIWLYDTFEGMTPPTVEDLETLTGNRAIDLLNSTQVDDGNNVWCVASITDVKSNLRETGYPPELLKFIKGDVGATLYQESPKSIALLRLDTDWYESTAIELEVLYPLLSQGGVCIIDDYGHWAGAKKAVVEYFAKNPPSPLLSRIDYTGRLLVKVKV